MKKLLMFLLAVGLILFLTRGSADVANESPDAAAKPAGAGAYWRILTPEGVHLTDVCDEPAPGDQYIAADNRLYEVILVDGQTAVAQWRGTVTLPQVDWLDADAALPVSAVTRRIALYCTHSDESYEPSDGYYSTNDRGSIYEVAQALADALDERGVEASVSDTLHHPHDAGAYRRSRQTAVQLLKTAPDCLLDIHRDGIPDPDSYAVTLGGEPASKVRILVGRGNQNMQVNKDFALLVKAVADRVYPGLIKDIYMGRGTFNQDLLPRSILLECGTYTLEKERVLRSMDRMAEVIDRALYGGVVGSAGRTVSDASEGKAPQGGITMGEANAPVQPDEAAGEGGVGSGLLWVGGVLVVGLVGYGILSAGSLRGGMRKAGRGLSEMTGGLIGRKPRDGEEHEHS